MNINISWDKEFEQLMLYLNLKYGDEMFDADGIGKQLDLNSFSKNFFKCNITADASVDSNANVVARTGVEYSFELPKPLRRYNSYFMLWKQLKKQFGREEANKIIEMQLCGDIYINDFVDVCSPYCFNYSTNDIAYNGLVGISKRMKIIPPKNFDTFIRQVEQFIVYAANSTLGATGFADLFIVGSYYVDLIKETGYDGHIRVDDLKTYLSEEITSFIYTINWEFRGNQSPFTNVSIFDKYFLQSLCSEYSSPITHKSPTIETVQMLQEIFIDVMNKELERTPLTFPVTTACFSIVSEEESKNSEEWKGYQINEPKDKDFVKFIAEKNKKFGFINMYAGETSQLSSCCRLRSNTKNEYFNSFGAGSTKIGCYDDKTEVLTDNGWKLFKDVNINNDLIFTMDDNRNTKFKKASKYHEYDFNGNLIKFNSKTVDLLVTPNHRMVTRSIKTNKLKFELAEDLYKKYQFSIPTHHAIKDDNYQQYFIIPACKINNHSYSEIKIPYTDWAKFMGIYLSEGSCDKENNTLNHGNERYRISISQSKTVNPEKCKKIEKLLDSLNLKYNYYNCNYSFENKPLCQYLRQFGNANSKFIPKDLINQSTDVLNNLWNWLIMGDGHINKKTKTESYWSISSKLISNIQEVLARLGYNSGYDKKENCYRLIKYRKQNSIIRQKNISTEKYNGKVYCLTVPNGRLFIKRNGHTCWSGNSLGVVTANLPRMAMKSKTREEFFDQLGKVFDVETKINNAKRNLVRRRIQDNAAPLYTLGFMDINKQYSTFGVVGLNEVATILGENILEKGGQELILDILRFINKKIDAANSRFKSPHNCEQVPAETSAIKLVAKDKLLGYDCSVPFYSNQFIPLTANADMLERIELQGKYDKLFSGGAILHINVDSEIKNTQDLVDLIEYTIKSGTVYFAINYKLRMCKNNHMWVGSDVCPHCGEVWTDEYTRVVGFLTNVKNWNKVRREEDWPNRKFYGELNN